MRHCKFTIFITLIFCLCFMTSVLANRSQIHLESTNDPVYVDQLYVTDGEGSYTGYKKLNGYPLQDKFQVYFQGNSSSFHSTFEDLRGIDRNEVISWVDDGKNVQCTRAYLYNMFSETIPRTSHRADYVGKFSQDWAAKTFGQVYSDWLLGQAFSDDASNLVNKYFESQDSIKPNDRFSLANAKINM